ncbi:hypothetical protein GCM10009661_67550 [Catellatospora chokoriensis]|uniref:Uncharacterized protein n=1 Tax=Catellatospora chokoriensis TaxID=310353 RepID=A0A8J3KCS1_9ACTN|nr:hypothetical protein Cch02nite_70330 [Catellatospora chokoriensis]
MVGPRGVLDPVQVGLDQHRAVAQVVPEVQQQVGDGGREHRDQGARAVLRREVAVGRCAGRIRVLMCHSPSLVP